MGFFSLSFNSGTTARFELKNDDNCGRPAGGKVISQILCTAYCIPYLLRKSAISIAKFILLLKALVN